jgi:oxalate decarboxylase/phosphoglucose isomerase-like protein (cupin superfamily)
MRGRPQVADVKTGDLWYFPPGLPHSLQGIGSTGAEFLLGFDNGKASEFNTLLLTDWVAARMTVFDTGPKAMTVDFRAGDIGYVKKSLGHYVENTGNTDLVFLELFKSDHYAEVSLSDWLAHTPPQLVMSHLKISPETLARFPKNRPDVVPL